MSERNVEALKKGIILVFIANIINLMISLLNGFVLPKYLSVDTYASIKTYQLYANYIGVLAFGYADGLYLKYGGVKISNVSNDDINICRSNLLIFQGIMTLVFVAIGLILQDYVLVIVALTIIPVNIASAFKNILQATGEFKFYSRIMNYTSVLTFVGTMFLLFVVKSDYDIFYILLMAGVTFLVWILIEAKLQSTYHYRTKFHYSQANLVENIKSGIILMLGNFSSIMMTSIDRWFVKFLLTTADFAYYSFVVSTENLVAVFINPIVTTMYNYICGMEDYTKLRRIKRMCLMFALFLVSSAFPVKFILEIYLTKYLPSQNVLFILFSTEILFVVIKGIYVNVYKAEKRQDIYLKQLVIAVILGCVFNALFYLIFKSNEGIALATLLSVLCWYAMCCKSVRELSPDFKEILVLIVSIPAFILSGILLPSILGFAVYICIALLLSAIFMREEFVSLIQMLISMVNKKLRKKAQ